MNNQQYIDIINKFIDLKNKIEVSEEDISSLRRIINEEPISKNNIYFQKIKLVSNALYNADETIKRKRTYKTTSIDIRDDFFNILKEDLHAEDSNNDSNYSEITLENVCRCLNNIIIPKKVLINENELEIYVTQHLRDIFGTQHIINQYRVEGGNFGMKTDIDVGGLVGIELKIYTPDWGAINSQKLFGQAIFYSKKKYHSKLIIFITGFVEYNSKLKEVQEFIKDMGFEFIYKKALICNKSDFE